MHAVQQRASHGDVRGVRYDEPLSRKSEGERTTGIMTSLYNMLDKMTDAHALFSGSLSGHLVTTADTPRAGMVVRAPFQRSNVFPFVLPPVVSSYTPGVGASA